MSNKRQAIERKTGTYQILGDFHYFIPNPLPPSTPPLELSNEIISLYGEASFFLGQLNEMSARLPDPKRFIKAYVIKEALLSSKFLNSFILIICFIFSS